MDSTFLLAWILHTLMKMFVYRWESRQPISYQCWTNKNYGLNNVEKYQKIIGCEFPGVSILSGTVCDLPQVQNKLNKLKANTKKMLFPSISGVTQCTMIILSNLAYPQWISVKCSEAVLPNVICFRSDNLTRKNFLSPNIKKECGDLHTTIHDMCYKFVWFNGTYMTIHMIEHECKMNRMDLSSVQHGHMFNFLFEASAQEELSVLSKSPTALNILILFFYEKLWLNYQYKRKSIQANYAKGYFVCEVKLNQHKTFSSNTFICTKGAFISTFFLCDGINDCNESIKLIAGSDEQGCEFNTHYKPFKKEYSTSISFCSPLHYKSARGKCVMYLSQDLNNYFTHHSNLTDTNSVKSYLISYYKKYPLFNSTLKNNHYSNTKCQMMGQLPCSLGHPICYNISDICIYRLGNSNDIYPCVTGLHIQQCRKFECHQHYKCPGYYCIPWTYVCDGKWDCPYGYDESQEHSCGTKRLCINKFKCRYSQICIHIHDVCNKIYDCPLHDDEALCQLKGIMCPKMCKCLNFALMCNAVSPEFITLCNLPYVAYHLVYVSINSIAFLKCSKFLMVLNVSGNFIADACEMESHRKLHFVDISWNNIRKLSRNCFNNMKNLRLIILKRNMISNMEAKSFHNLNNIFMIDLSSNNLSNLLEDAFVNISIIQIIKLNNNPLTQLLHIKIMVQLTVQTVYSSNFYICCTLSSNTICLAPKPWYVSCSNLLPSPAIKIVLIILSLTVIVANLIPLLMKCKVLKRKLHHEVFNIIVFYINMGDLLCGMYLTILWIADAIYGDRFIIMRHKWKNGFPCYLSFAFILFSSLILPYLLSLLSVARLMVVVFPLHSKFKSSRFVFKCIMVGVFLISLIVLGAEIPFTLGQEMHTNLCSPFMDPTAAAFEVKLLTWLVAIWQIVTFLLISVVYNFLIISLKKMDRTDFISPKRMDKYVILQLTFVTVSNVFSWFPSSVLFITSLYLTRYPKRLPLWTTVAIMPLNSIINPFVFTYITRKKTTHRVLPSTEASSKAI